MTNPGSRLNTGLGRALEDAFFLEEDKRLIEKQRQLRQMQETKQALREVSGITNDHVLDKLVALGVRPELVASLAVVPLIEVAWADGEVDAKERAAILERLAGVAGQPNGIEVSLVESWLQRRPDPALMTAWQQYVKGVCEGMSAEERAEFKDVLLKDTRAIAEASGGFLGVRPISAAEARVLKQLEESFG